MFKKLLLLLTLSVGFVFGQSGTLTDDIYWASKPPAIVALHAELDMTQRDHDAQVLAAQGFIIDRQIDVWAWSPTLVMVARQSYGYVWSPNAFQPNDPNILDYQDITKRWLNSIAVSTDAKDYPAFNSVVPVKVVPPVGILMPDGTYAANTLGIQSQGVFLFRDGDQFTEARGTFTFHNQPGLFAPITFWTLNK